MNEMMEWIAVSCCSGKPSIAELKAKVLTDYRGWGYAGSSTASSYSPHIFLWQGYNLTTVQCPPNFLDLLSTKAKNCSWARRLGRTKPTFSFMTPDFVDDFPGVFVVTTDGRAFVLTGYDFWKDKPREATLLGNFLVKLVADPRVAQIYDLGGDVTLSGKQPTRVYSEQDLWTLLENPTLVLADVENITSAVQQLNALKVELVTLEQQKAELQAHMQLLAQQAQMAAGEQAGTQAELQAAQQQLNTVMQEEAAKLAQASALEQSISAASLSKKTVLLVLGGAALLGVGYLVLRKR